ncbi:alcohol oxidase [Aspergillus steynii IBT 23096]|uniref:Alcohol oxidase n=1 Tax=Aspergillus steynii IBT 23096 TaxID=1392250 RepID=A0A2I2G6X4_9EURO|nr:alcohol oxidase [Aspergillus steynii IBT 23096]PLB48624.1 alcohol oxidase [Aspergillus steynii IBT 23096]
MANSPSQTRGAICSLDEFLQVSFDYLIVGGGTAGLTLAARLSEDPSVTVGVIEAGKDQTKNEFVRTPAMFPQMLGIPEYDWMLETVPQKWNGNKVHAMTRGKMLGGSSATNGMMYVRGHKQDFDDWSAFGKGWSWSSVAPYFRKHESLEDNRSGEPGDFSFLNFGEKSHGESGPVSTSFNNWRNPLERYFIEAAKTASGMQNSPADPWGGDHLGFFSSLLTVDRSKDKGTRSYAASAYLLPNASRPNLKVLTEALALNVILEGNSAQGVRISHTGREYDVRATREVILSCGTYKSPQLLELSGIGNPSILESAGIKCAVPLPGVGESLQDHVLSATTYELKEGTVSFDSLRKPEVLQQHLDLYAKERRGILAAGTGCMGFLPYSSLVSPQEVTTTCDKVQQIPNTTSFQQRQLEQVASQLRSPSSGNIQYILFQGTMNVDEVIQDQGKFAKPGTPSDPDGFTLVTCLQYPASRGTVHITSSDPTKNPAVDPAYLSNSADVDVLAAAMGMCEKIVNSAPLKDKIQRRMHPAPSVQLGDREQAKAAVRDFCMTEYHPCGTCAIGQVVDERLRVNGVKGLRVCDASVFPGNVSGNILSSVYAVAERAADMIKEDGSKAKALL